MDKTDQEPVLVQIKCRKRSWLGHTLWRNDESIFKRRRRRFKTELDGEKLSAPLGATKHKSSKSSQVT